MSFQCSRCGQSVKDENGVKISGKYYGRDCASTILGINLPQWFVSGDWYEAKAKHEIDQSVIQDEISLRKETIRENWALIKSISEAFHTARVNENSFEISFLSSIALIYGIQFAKESAYLFDDFDSWVMAGKYQDEKFKTPTLTEKQKSILNKLI